MFVFLRRGEPIQILAAQELLGRLPSHACVCYRAATLTRGIIKTSLQHSSKQISEVSELQHVNLQCARTLTPCHGAAAPGGTPRAAVNPPRRKAAGCRLSELRTEQLGTSRYFFSCYTRNAPVFYSEQKRRQIPARSSQHCCRAIQARRDARHGLLKAPEETFIPLFHHYMDFPPSPTRCPRARIRHTMG